MHCRCRQLLLGLVTLRDTNTLGRTPLDAGSVRRRDLYTSTTHNIHKRQTSMPPPLPPAGFEHTIPASVWPQTHALDRVATGISMFPFMINGSPFRLSLIRFSPDSPNFFQTNCRILCKFKPRPPLFTAFLIRCSLTVHSLDAV
jgi:hypothetical protein